MNTIPEENIRAGRSLCSIQLSALKGISHAGARSPQKQDRAINTELTIRLLHHDSRHTRHIAVAMRIGLQRGRVLKSDWSESGIYCCRTAARTAGPPQHEHRVCTNALVLILYGCYGNSSFHDITLHLT